MPDRTFAEFGTDSTDSCILAEQLSVVRGSGDDSIDRI